jgi:hypothetical protein
MALRLCSNWGLSGLVSRWFYWRPVYRLPLSFLGDAQGHGKILIDLSAEGIIDQGFYFAIKRLLDFQGCGQMVGKGIEKLHELSRAIGNDDGEELEMDELEQMLVKFFRFQLVVIRQSGFLVFVGIVVFVVDGLRNVEKFIPFFVGDMICLDDGQMAVVFKNAVRFYTLGNYVWLRLPGPRRVRWR